MFCRTLALRLLSVPLSIRKTAVKIQCERFSSSFLETNHILYLCSTLSTLLQCRCIQISQPCFLHSPLFYLPCLSMRAPRIALLRTAPLYVPHMVCPLCPGPLALSMFPSGLYLLIRLRVPLLHSPFLLIHPRLWHLQPTTTRCLKLFMNIIGRLILMELLCSLFTHHLHITFLLSRRCQQLILPLCSFIDLSHLPISRHRLMYRQVPSSKPILWSSTSVNFRLLRFEPSFLIFPTLFFQVFLFLRAVSLKARSCD